MNIGKKIKNIRTSKLITQKELAGDMITRNMLSRIENGAALPSVPTVLYLAKKLNVPVGYLLSNDENGELYYKKYANYDNLIEAYKTGEWEICRDLCLESCISDKDNEVTYLLAETSMRLGINEFNSGRLHHSLLLFDEATSYAEKTVISTDAQISCIVSYLRFMELISPTLGSDIPESASELEYKCINDFCKYESIFFSGNDYVKGSTIWNNESYGYHLYARTLINKNDFGTALSLLSVIADDETLPRPVAYIIYGDYEKCCKETGDYKNAYELSEIKMQLFEKLVSED